MDASQIKCGYILFQLSHEGLMQLIKCESRLLKQSGRNRGAARRELISLYFALIENECVIRNHGGSVLMLSDASSLQLISRGNTSNTVFSEIGCLISSFGNLGYYYCLGSALFLSDLFSRSFNEVLLKNGSNLSKEFEQLLPNLPKNPNQKMLTPKQITDFLVFTPPTNVWTFFLLFREYSQITNRYFTIKDFTRFDSQIFPEIDLLCSLYTGFNGKDLTQEKLQENNERLARFPASGLPNKS